MTLEEFNNSLGALIVQKDSLNAQFTGLIQAIGQHAQALVEYEQELRLQQTTTDETEETTATDPE